MNTVHRRTEIINILIIRRHTTANELAQEFGVSIRTIQYDIQALTPVYPIYTKQGENGGIFIREDYKPYANSLTPMEVAAFISHQMLQIAFSAIISCPCRWCSKNSPCVIRNSM